jgi:XTP/dITP diphosphohydrolase
MEIVLATSNRHKVKELEPLFPDHHLIVPDELGFYDITIVEDGDSFFANAYKKAEAVYEIVHRPVLADDSGLCVPALGGAPGIHSARFGTMEGEAVWPAEKKNILLLSLMKDIEDRRCAFYCCLVLMYGEGRFFSVQETVPGELLRAPQGNSGFGYDPIVFIGELGMSVAELSAEEKNRISHRGRAASKMNRILHDMEF